MLEETKGNLPVWLAPHQVKILPIADRHVEYARELEDKLRRQMIRVDVDDRAEKIGYKIREAQLQKVPYMLVIGDNEVENGTVNVRIRGEQEQLSMSKDEFVQKVASESKAPSSL